MFASMFTSMFMHNVSLMWPPIAPPNNVCFSLFSPFPLSLYFFSGSAVRGRPTLFSGVYLGFVLSLAEHEIDSHNA